MRTAAWILVLAVVVGWSGCGGPKKFEVPNPAPGEVVFLPQTYPLDKVLGRAGGLHEGMTRVEVLRVLGKPAYMAATAWDYVSHDVQGTPVFGPHCHRFTLHFDGDRFLGSELADAPRLSPESAR